MHVCTLSLLQSSGSGALVGLDRNRMTCCAQVRVRAFLLLMLLFAKYLISHSRRCRSMLYKGKPCCTRFVALQGFQSFSISSFEPTHNYHMLVLLLLTCLLHVRMCRYWLVRDIGPHSAPEDTQAILFLTLGDLLKHERCMQCNHTRRPHGLSCIIDSHPPRSSSVLVLVRRRMISASMPVHPPAAQHTHRNDRRHSI